MARSRFAMLAPLLALIGMAAVPSSPQFKSRRAELAAQRVVVVQDFNDDTRAELSLTPLLSIVVVIIVAIVSLGLIARLAPNFLTSISGIVSVFSSGNYTTGDATADTIMPTFGLLVAFLGLFALVGLVFAAVELRRGGGGA